MLKHTQSLGLYCHFSHKTRRILVFFFGHQVPQSNRPCNVAYRIWFDFKLFFGIQFSSFIPYFYSRPHNFSLRESINQSLCVCAFKAYLLHYNLFMNMCILFYIFTHELMFTYIQYGYTKYIYIAEEISDHFVYNLKRTRRNWMTKYRACLCTDQPNWSKMNWKWNRRKWYNDCEREDQEVEKKYVKNNAELREILKWGGKKSPE